MRTMKTELQSWSGSKKRPDRPLDVALELKVGNVFLIKNSWCVLALTMLVCQICPLSSKKWMPWKNWVGSFSWKLLTCMQQRYTASNCGVIWCYNCGPNGEMLYCSGVRICSFNFGARWQFRSILEPSPCPCNYLQAYELTLKSSETFELCRKIGLCLLLLVLHCNFMLWVIVKMTNFIMFCSLFLILYFQERIEYSKTFQGKYFNFLGYFFSIYCVWKIFMVCKCFISFFSWMYKYTLHRLCYACSSLSNALVSLKSRNSERNWSLIEIKLWIWLFLYSITPLILTWMCFVLPLAVWPPPAFSWWYNEPHLWEWECFCFFAWV